MYNISFLKIGEFNEKHYDGEYNEKHYGLVVNYFVQMSRGYDSWVDYFECIEMRMSLW